jgi:HD-GYP domain-containing protein (c-di-GMP phosphodiesterase class II)
LRDKETEEHTRRVSDTTVKLAVHLGVGDASLVHIRRGAILHDIGKVAIPDRILFKPGPLADDEWHIMRRHPGIAVDLLSPVTYLAPALDIPHWHHEKWDGTGYPDHLRGEGIPFPARLFALVDVYDALTSDRPYRKAWSKQETLQYIESQSGKHFDPAIVPEFVQYMNTHSV